LIASSIEVGFGERKAQRHPWSALLRAYNHVW
jgi:hypothetical protein